ncbi:MAG TPA: L,D-transpeptidase family protein [Myxococcota bacterium]|nr:L,D-transpeptidase family protein [Myxococcota bacterium]
MRSASLRSLCILVPLLLALAATAAARGHRTKPAGPEPLRPVLGQPSKDLIEADDTLLDVAYRHRLGFDALARLNPGINVWIPDPGEVVELPTQYILPDGDPKGVVINVPEMRLYDFTRGTPPELFAIAIGDEEDPSLYGKFKVGPKRKDPAWHVPASIRAEKPELPAMVPAGEDNPLGTRWMTIDNTSYGVHGTNNNWSIGRTATHGCIRLYNDQMERLYERIPTGTPLLLEYQPVKVGRLNNGIYVEAHPDIYGRVPDRTAYALHRLGELGLLSSVDLPTVERVIGEARGAPVRVGTLPDAH